MATEEEVKIKSKDSKKDKKEKKRSESDGVHKSKKDKKDKKADKEKLKAKVAEALDNQLQADVAASAKADDDDHPGSDVDDIKNPEVKTQLVYFAVPLADVKGHKKIYKTIKKGRFPATLFCLHLYIPTAPSRAPGPVAVPPTSPMPKQLANRTPSPQLQPGKQAPSSAASRR